MDEKNNRFVYWLYLQAAAVLSLLFGGLLLFIWVAYRLILEVWDE